MACHLVLLGCLLGVDRARDGAPAARMPTAPSPAALLANEERLQRQIQILERIKRQLHETGAPGQPGERRAAPPPESAERGPETGSRINPERKARALAADIERTLQQDKARELARLLKIPEDAALKQLQAERKSGKPLSIDALTQRANEALVFRLRERNRQRDGVHLGGQPGTRTPPNATGTGANPAGPVLGMGYDPDSTHTVVEHRNYDAELGTPMVDASRMRAGAGRIFGAAGTFANRVYLNSWYMIGPFAGFGQESIDSGYPPESIIDLDAAYASMHGRVLRWQYEQFSQYPLVPTAYREAAVYYGYTEIDMDRERDVLLSMGADDDAKLWVNDELVWRSGNNVKPWYRLHYKYLNGRVDTLNLNEETRVVRLHKGRNRLLFKLYNGSGATFISIVMSSS